MKTLISPKDIDRIFTDIGFGALTTAEKKELLPKILDHMNEVAMKTVLENMNGEQLTKFEAAIDDATNGEQTIADIVADMPGIAGKIQDAVRAEAAALRDAGKLI